MSSPIIQEITDKSVASNFEAVGPKRNATAVNNAQRETLASQAKANERNQNTIVGAADGNPAVETLAWIDKRFSQITREIASPAFNPSARNILSVNMEVSRLSVLAQTAIKAAQAQQKLHELVMRSMLLDC